MPFLAHTPAELLLLAVRICFVNALIAALACCPLSQHARAETHAEMRVECYYIDPCGGCRSMQEGGCGKCLVEDALRKRLTLLLKAQLQAGEVRLVLQNIATDPALFEERKLRVEQAGEDTASVGYPTIFIGDALFAGDGSQDAAIAEYVASGAETYAGYAENVRRSQARAAARGPRRVLYLYSPFCADCEKLDNYLRAYLPADMTLEKYSIAEEDGFALELALSQRYGLDLDSFFVPFMLYGDEYFMGTDEIYLRLISRIEEFPEATTPAAEDLLAAFGWEN